MNQNMSVLKKVRTHGVLFLVEAFIASMLAAAVLLQISWLRALGYLFILMQLKNPLLSQNVVEKKLQDRAHSPYISFPRERERHQSA